MLGDTVNLASRLEGLNRDYGTHLLVSRSVVDEATCEAEEAFVWRRVDRVLVRGRKQAVDVYEPLGLQGEVPPEVWEFTRGYERALGLYQHKQFAEALETLRGPAAQRPDDRSVRRLTALCKIKRFFYRLR